MEKKGQALIVAIQGELDLHTSPEFKTEISKAFAAHLDLKYLIFNVKEMTFIDSSGLGVILGRYRDLQDREGRLYFVQANPQIKRVLEFSGLRKISIFADSTQEVLEQV